MRISAENCKFREFIAGVENMKEYNFCVDSFFSQKSVFDAFDVNNVIHIFFMGETET